jgi:cysteine desulfurase
MSKVYRLVEPMNPNKIYYFDNNATTFIYDNEVLKELVDWANSGNPSNNLHIAGILAKQKVEECRKIVADDLKVEPNEILFTGNATEANNIVLQGIINKHMESDQNAKYTIITSNFEHPSVLNVFKHYQNNPRIDVIMIEIRSNKSDPYYGSVDPQDIVNAIKTARNKVILLSMMYANNETGAIQNIAEIGKIAQQNKIFFHSDVTQAIGKMLIHPKEIGIDSITFSGHKFHAPKGIGVLYVKKDCGIEGICYGGEQEESVRPGTESVPSIATIALALKKVHQNRDAKTKEMQNLRKYIKYEMEKMNVTVIEPNHGVLPNTLLIILHGIDTCNKNFTRELSTLFHICVGVSSACQTKKSSHVLNAMKIEEQNKDKVIRISLSDYTTHSECQYLIDSLRKLLIKHRSV